MQQRGLVGRQECPTDARGAFIQLTDEGLRAIQAAAPDHVETVRRHVAGLPDQSTGWLAGARDPVVGRSLALLHKRPEHPWTVAELAAAVGVSRSALVARFTRYLADPPMAYLTGWRLRLAAQALTSSSRGVADVAAAVGYESEAAFNRAFKRVFGVPPAQYRRQTRKAASLDRAQLPATVSPPTR